MSKDGLYWRPVPKPLPEPDSLPDALRHMLSKRYKDFGGWMSGESMGMGEGHIPYLEGLRDAGVNGAQELINIIGEYGVVELWVDE